MLKTKVPDKLRELVTKFALNEAHYKSQDFLETQVRVEFINPLLRLLGWDIDNESGYAPEYKDVIHELHAGGKKHIDYIFKVGQVIKFLIEAKRPSADVENSKQHAYQAKLYAYEQEIPLVLLTDFEELAIYQGYRDKKTAKPPRDSDDPLERRVFFCRYHEYPKYWNFLYSLLSKKAILLGLHDHLLQRLDAVATNISHSIYTMDKFNLLYSIAQSFGGEELIVEQDIEIPSEQALPHHLPDSARVTHVNKANSELLRERHAPEFYLAPVYI